MSSTAHNGSSGLGSLKAEMDAAFAAVQRAMVPGRYGKDEARTLAFQQVTKLAALVRIALAELDRGEADKRLLQAKMRALMEAAGRIPAS